MRGPSVADVFHQGTTSGRAPSPLEAVRILATHLDGAVEELLDAHDFRLRAIDAAESGAQALFTRDDGAAESAWALKIAQGAGALRITLDRRKGPATPLSLAIQVDEGGARSLGKAVGMAVCLVDFVEQQG